MTTHNDAPTVAAQQCGREPDAYEVRCTDGNYEWRRPYHGELEVIMRTGRDRSGKPFECRALYAAVSPLSTVTPAEVGGLVDRLENERPANMMSVLALHLDAASLIQSQAARIAELEAELRETDCPRPCNHRPDDFTVGQCVEADECGCRHGRPLLSEARVAARRAREQGGENNDS